MCVCVCVCVRVCKRKHTHTWPTEIGCPHICASTSQPHPRQNRSSRRRRTQYQQRSALDYIGFIGKRKKKRVQHAETTTKKKKQHTHCSHCSQFAGSSPYTHTQTRANTLERIQRQTSAASIDRAASESSACGRVSRFAQRLRARARATRCCGQCLVKMCNSRHVVCTARDFLAPAAKQH